MNQSHVKHLLGFLYARVDDPDFSGLKEVSSFRSEYIAADTEYQAIVQYMCDKDWIELRGGWNRLRLLPEGTLEAERGSLAASEEIKKRRQLRWKILTSFVRIRESGQYYAYWDDLLKELEVPQAMAIREIFILEHQGLVEGAGGPMSRATDRGVEEIGDGKWRDEAPDEIQGVVVRGDFSEFRNGKILRGRSRIISALAKLGYVGGERALSKLIDERGCPVRRLGARRSYEADAGELAAWARQFMDDLSIQQATSATRVDPQLEIGDSVAKRFDKKGADISLNSPQMGIKKARKRSSS